MQCPHLMSSKHLKKYLPTYKLYRQDNNKDLSIKNWSFINLITSCFLIKCAKNRKNENRYQFYVQALIIGTMFLRKKHKTIEIDLKIWEIQEIRRICLLSER